MPDKTKKIIVVVLLSLILLASFLVRVIGVNFGTPVPVHPDEHFLVEPALDVADGDLNPGWFGSPGSTIIYADGLIFYIYNSYRDFADGHHISANTRYATNPTNFLILGRMLPVALGTLIMLLVFLIGRELKNPWLGLIAAVIVGGAPYMSGYARIIHPDVASAFFVTMAAWSSIKISKTQAWRWYILSGVSVGLATATKYPTVVSILLILVSHGIATRNGFGWRAWLSRFFGSRRFWLSIVFAITVFLAAVPFFIPEWQTVLRDVREEARTEHFGWHIVGFWDHLKFYWDDALVNGFGDLIRYLSGFGLLILLFSKQLRRQSLPLIIFLFAFVLFISSLTLHWGRWIIPDIPIMAILAAVMVYWLVDVFRPRWVQVIVALACLLVFSGPTWLLSSVRAWQSTFTETQTDAYYWQQTIPDDEIIAAETATIFNKVPLDSNTKVIGFLGPNPNYLAWVDYVVVNEEIDSRYLKEPGKYYAESEVYKHLTQYGRLVRKFSSQPLTVPFFSQFSFLKNQTSVGTPGPTIDAYRLYKPSDALADEAVNSLPKAVIPSVAFRGTTEFVVYTKNDLVLSLVATDKNENERDDISVRIWRGEDTIDAWKISDESIGNHEINIKKTNSRSGAFRIRITASTNIYLGEIKAPHQLLALQGMFTLANCESPLTLFMNGTMLEAMSVHEAGLQTITIDAQELNLDKTKQWKEISGLTGTSKVTIPVCDAQMSTNGLLSFQNEVINRLNTKAVQDKIVPFRFMPND